MQDTLLHVASRQGRAGVVQAVASLVRCIQLALSCRQGNERAVDVAIDQVTREAVETTRAIDPPVSPSTSLI
jgi:hypothetical protein